MISNSHTNERASLLIDWVNKRNEHSVVVLNYKIALDPACNAINTCRRDKINYLWLQ